MKSFAFISFAFLAPSLLWAEHYADRIEEIRVSGNAKTRPDVIIAISGLKVGQEITEELLSDAHTRLLSASIFKSAEVTAEPATDEKRVVSISVEEKITWFAVPAFSYSKNAMSYGLAIGEQDFLGYYKKGLVYGDWGPLLRRAVLAYRDPQVFASRFIFSLDVIARRDDMIEYANRQEIRRVRLHEYGFTALPGYKFTDHFSVSLGAYYRRIREGLLSQAGDLHDPDNLTEGNDLSLDFKVAFDGMKEFHGMFEGSKLSFESQISDSRFSSDFNYFKQVLWVERDFLFLNKNLNWLNKVSIQLGRTLPYYYELMVGGDNLRGYLNRQFRGDTRYSLQEEAVFNVWNFKWFTLRGATFWDSTAIYFKDDQFRASNWHNGIGAGVRIYLKGIAIPLVGYDFGYGIEDKAYSTYLHIGAQF